MSKELVITRITRNEKEYLVSGLFEEKKAVELRVERTDKNSILFRGVTVEKDAVVENCILMQETAIGTAADIKNVISDKNAAIGNDMVLKGTPEKCVFLKKNQVL